MRQFVQISFSFALAFFLAHTSNAILPSIEREVSSFSFDYDRDGMVTSDEILRLKSDSASIQVQFFEDDDVIEFIKQFDFTEGSTYYWYGTVSGRMDSNLNIMIDNDDRITGSLSTRSKVYSIVTMPDDSVIIQEYDVSSFPRDEEPESRNDRMLQLSSDYHEMKLLSERDLQITDDDGSVIDIICLYTPQAVCSFSNGGTCNPTNVNLQKIMEDKCRLSMLEANVAYKESGAETSLNLVYTGLVDANYKEESDMCATLNMIRSNSGKAYQNIRALRETYKADLVTMLVSSTQYCGCGDIFNGNPDAAFSLVSHHCATGYYSVAHEIGHNMGCNHNRSSEQNILGTAFSYGYLDPEYDFRTIMSYDCPTKSCPRIQRFSTSVSSTKYDGQVLGSPLHDNVRQINNVKYTVANYRKSGRQTNTGDSGTGDSTNIVVPVPVSAPVRPPTAAPTTSPTTASTPSDWLRCRTVNAKKKRNNCVKLSGCIWTNNSCYHFNSTRGTGDVVAPPSSVASAPVSPPAPPPTASNSCSSLSTSNACKTVKSCKWKNNACVSK